MIELYGNGVIIGTATGAASTLPYTGLSVAWAFLAGFALVAAGLALMRTAPRKQS